VRIGVLSDTHRDLNLARTALEQMGEIDLLLHAGDHYNDALVLAEEFGLVTKAVIGNCDHSLSKPKEEILELEGYKILLTHGHRYGVKFGLQRLYFRGLEVGANIIVFGHTHMPVHVVEDNIHLLNPGSPTLPRDSSKPSYALIECKPELEIKIKEIVK